MQSALWLVEHQSFHLSAFQCPAAWSVTIHSLSERGIAGNSHHHVPARCAGPCVESPAGRWRGQRGAEPAGQGGAGRGGGGPALILRLMRPPLSYRACATDRPGACMPGPSPSQLRQRRLADEGGRGAAPSARALRPRSRHTGSEGACRLTASAWREWRRGPLLPSPSGATPLRRATRPAAEAAAPAPLQSSVLFVGLG